MDSATGLPQKVFVYYATARSCAGFVCLSGEVDCDEDPTNQAEDLTHSLSSSVAV
jgi:hypothetical protein